MMAHKAQRKLEASIAETDSGSGQWLIEDIRSAVRTFAENPNVQRSSGLQEQLRELVQQTEKLLER